MSPFPYSRAPPLSPLKEVVSSAIAYVVFQLDQRMESILLIRFLWRIAPSVDTGVIVDCRDAAICRARQSPKFSSGIIPPAGTLLARTPEDKRRLREIFE